MEYKKSSERKMLFSMQLNKDNEVVRFQKETPILHPEDFSFWGKDTKNAADILKLHTDRFSKNIIFEKSDSAYNDELQDIFQEILTLDEVTDTFSICIGILQDNSFYFSYLMNSYELMFNHSICFKSYNEMLDMLDYTLMNLLTKHHLQFDYVCILQQTEENDDYSTFMVVE